VDSAYGLKWFEGKKDFVLAEVLCARLRLLSAEDASQMHLKYFFPWPNGFWKTAKGITVFVQSKYAFWQ
jgi:hypothetical protein